MDNSLQEIKCNHFVVLAYPRYRVQDVFTLIADLALHNTVRVVDGGNLFNVLTLNRVIRRKTERVEEYWVESTSPALSPATRWKPCCTA
jgi:hypothetical protein